MKPLLWKELRELRAWIVIAGTLIGASRLLCFSSSFEKWFFSGFQFWQLQFFVATLVAIGLGVSQVARERQAHTLDYLSVRPVAPVAIVWTKFLVGTMALLLLVIALVWLGFTNPPALYMSWIRRRFGFETLVLTFFLRVWCAYALALLFSVLVDRTVKAAVATTVFLFGLYILLLSFRFNGGPLLVDTTLDWTLFAVGDTGWITGVSLCCVALGMAFCAAALLQRSPESYWGTRTLTLGAVGMIVIAVLAGRVFPEERLPLLARAGSLEFHTQDDIAEMAASPGLVCLGLRHGLIFLDFSDPAKPKKVAEAQIPLWTTSGVTLAGREAYVVGRRKALPIDEDQIIAVKLVGQDSVEIEAPMSLGPTGSSWIGHVVPLGHFLYTTSTSDRGYRIHAFDLSTKHETAALTMDPRGTDDPVGETRLCLRDSYLYVASPLALTTFDLGNPAQPVITSRIGAKISSVYALVTQEKRLLELSFDLGQRRASRSYDLSEPSRPIRTEDFAWPFFYHLAVSGPAFYAPWADGVIEFQPKARKLEEIRYSRELYEKRVYVNKIVAAGAYIYAAGYDSERKVQFVSAFRVRE